MTNEVGYVPRDPGSAAEDRRIAALAAVLAVRRHVVAHEADEPGDIGLLVLTGGVFRRPDAYALAAVVATLRADVELAGAAGQGPGRGGRRLRGRPRGHARRRRARGGRPDAAAGPPAGLSPGCRPGGFDIAGTARDPGRVRPARAERRCSGLDLARAAASHEVRGGRVGPDRTATLGPRCLRHEGRLPRSSRRPPCRIDFRMQRSVRATVPTAFRPAAPPARSGAAAA